MRHRSTLVRPLIVLLGGLLLCLSAACGDDDGAAGDRVDLDFAAATVDGGEIDMGDYAGEDLVLWFWTPWCTSCNQQAPALAEVLIDRMDVHFVGMTGQADTAEMAEFVTRHGLDGIPNVIDPDGSIWARFASITRSAFIFVDDDGSTSRTDYGVLSVDEINARIDDLLAN